MTELENIPQAERERIEKLGGADLVIGILAAGAPAELEPALAKARDSLSHLRPDLRTVVIHPGEQIAPGEEHGIRTLAYPLLSIDPFLSGDPSPDAAQSIASAYQALFAVSRNLGARAVGGIVSDLDSLTPQWFYRLLQPILELDFDVVTPAYTHRPLEGLLNAGIVAPFTRALYGKQVQHPLGPDFGFSGRYVQHVLTGQASHPAVHPRSIAALAVDAICYGFEICQAHVGVRRYPPSDWMNQSSVLTQILTPVFAESAQHAAYWQRIRSSEPVPAFGAAETLPAASDPLDVRRMIESFHLGCRNLQEIWGLVLPPGSLLQLAKLARLPFDQFHMPDTLWARIIYDFALGHRLRLMSQEHLLGAMTPLYLAWVASYALEIGSDSAGAADRRLEELAQAFEASKPYAVSRWRWPDRFNP